MDSTEASPQDFIDYGTLIGFMYMLGAADSFPENHDPHIIIGRCQVYETVLAALGNAPVGARYASIRAQILAFTDQRRSYAISAIGGKRGDMGAIWDELTRQTSDINRQMLQIGGQLGIYRRKEIAP